MLASLLCLASVIAAPEIPVRPGTSIVLDGKLGGAEWVDAAAFDQNGIRLQLKRNGPWLAIALSSNRTYRGEVMRIYTADDDGAWVAGAYFGIGQPAMPPMLWRRGTKRMLLNPRFVPESPRACRARVHVVEKDGWSVEYLVRLSALGIGRGDRRLFRGFFSVSIPGPGDDESYLLTLPSNMTELVEPKGYARLVSPDRWGESERWPAVTLEESREFDDHELLYRLYLEHDKIAAREATDQLVIANAVRPRVTARIAALKALLDAGQKRNPTLPAWSYFKGRLLHEGNYYAEARKIVEAIPAALAHLDPFVNLAAEHYLDTGDYEQVFSILTANRTVRGGAETEAFALALREGSKLEAAAIERDEKKQQKNPRVRLKTTKGDIVCELFEDDAPHAVNNFVDLVLRHRYYDGLSFFNVQGGLLAQMGDPRTRGGGGTRNGPAWLLRPDNSRRVLLRGYLATVPAKSGAFHGSHFILSVAPLLRESARVTVFGRVLEGQEVVESLEGKDKLITVEIEHRRNHVYDATESRIR